MHNMKMPTFQKQDKTIRTSVPAAKKVDVLVTVVNSDPEHVKVDWNVKNVAIRKFSSQRYTVLNQYCRFWL